MAREELYVLTTCELIKIRLMYGVHSTQLPTCDTAYISCAYRCEDRWCSVDTFNVVQASDSVISDTPTNSTKSLSTATLSVRIHDTKLYH